MHDDAPGVRLRSRNVGADLVLVPTQWLSVGDTDAAGTTWTEDDMAGLVRDGDRGYVVEGFYLEHKGRTAPDTRFDGAGHGGGVLAWHFDATPGQVVFDWSNGAQNDSERLQMDVLEWDRNDDTQDLQLWRSYSEPEDHLAAAATGITSGARRPDVSLGPIASTTFSGLVPPGFTYDHPFTVGPEAAGRRMVAGVTGVGDCTIQLLRNGQPATSVGDSAGMGARDEVAVARATPGDWIARVGDFTACGAYSGDIAFPTEAGFTTSRGADTWSSWTQQPTGWAFTNVGAEIGDAITLDVLQLADEIDVSPGFVSSIAPVLAGRTNALVVPVFSNGGVPPGLVSVVVRDDDGAVVAATTVSLDSYERVDVPFTFSPAAPAPPDSSSRSRSSTVSRRRPRTTCSARRCAWVPPTPRCSWSTTTVRPTARPRSPAR